MTTRVRPPLLPEVIFNGIPMNAILFTEYFIMRDRVNYLQRELAFIQKKLRLNGNNNELLFLFKCKEREYVGLLQDMGMAETRFPNLYNAQHHRSTL